MSQLIQRFSDLGSAAVHFVMAVLMLIVLGCDPPSNGGPALSTSELDAQRARVTSGESDTIHVQQSIVADSHLVRLQGLDRLRELLLEQTTITDKGCEVLKSLSQLEHLRIRGGAIGDDGLRAIASLPALKRLNLPQAVFTNAGLSELRRAEKLELLRFGSPNVTDEGMESIAALPRLRFLHLIDVPITDAGLAKLHGMKTLESLYLDGTQATDEGIERLLKALPDVHLHIDQQHHDRDPHRHDH